jgi:hypothetical protein
VSIASKQAPSGARRRAAEGQAAELLRAFRSTVVAFLDADRSGEGEHDRRPCKRPGNRAANVPPRDLGEELEGDEREHRARGEANEAGSRPLTCSTTRNATTAPTGCGVLVRTAAQN